MKRNNLLAVLLPMAALTLGDAAYADTPRYDFVQLGVMTGDYADIKPFDLFGIEAEGSMEKPIWQCEILTRKTMPVFL